MNEDGRQEQQLRSSRNGPRRQPRGRTVLYYWRLVRQLPWLVLRYKL